MTKSWLGTGTWCGIIFLLVVSPSFGDLQSIELHRTLGQMLLGIKARCGAHQAGLSQLPAAPCVPPCTEAVFLGWRRKVDTGKRRGLKTLSYLALMAADCPFISGPMDSPPSESLETTQQLWPRCCTPPTARGCKRAAQGTCLTPKPRFRRALCLLNTLSPMSLLNAPSETHQAAGTRPVCQPPMCMVEHIQPKAPQQETGKKR